MNNSDLVDKKGILYFFFLLMYKKRVSPLNAIHMKKLIIEETEM